VSQALKCNNNRRAPVLEKVIEVFFSRKVNALVNARGPKKKAQRKPGQASKRQRVPTPSTKGSPD